MGPEAANENFTRRLKTAALSPETLFQLGLNFATGRGLPQDKIAAHAWFNLAASRGHVGARIEREALSLELSDAERALALAQARQWAQPRAS